MCNKSEAVSHVFQVMALHGLAPASIQCSAKRAVNLPRLPLCVLLLGRWRNIQSAHSHEGYNSLMELSLKT